MNATIQIPEDVHRHDAFVALHYTISLNKVKAPAICILYTIVFLQ